MSETKHEDFGLKKYADAYEELQAELQSARAETLTQLGIKRALNRELDAARETIIVLSGALERIVNMSFAVDRAIPWQIAKDALAQTKD